ncbi:MAG TPA: ABC transporter substrate binding protein [Methylomirabilota bacterium]|nr:ABC transporter substrate binding protein [Methylomirabilota bacterium]
MKGPNHDLGGVFHSAAKRRANAVVTIRSLLLLRFTKQITDLAIKNWLPSVFDTVQFVKVGGVIAYSANEAEAFRRAAVYVDKILKGAKPAELPTELPTKFELFINLKTAKLIGVTIPPTVLYQADKVIK